VNRDDYDAFSAAIAGRDHEVDLFGAAMIVARLGEDDTDPNATAARLDVIAEEARAYAGEGADADALAHAVEYQLFSVCGFRGNAEDYSDPRNSFLDQVVSRRLGIPLTLSLVYMEVAQRVGLQCDGVGYPGHFIVRYGTPEEPVFVDPFQQGVRIDREELLSRLRGQPLGGASPDSFLAAVTRRQVLQRMLNNLHAIFRERRDLNRWLSVVELQLRLEPWNALLTGERGMLRYRLSDLEGALADLEAYVSAGDAPEANPGAIRLLDQLRLRYGGTGGPR
jgi:regulator of sirC expression with transglutaminase-like and TPR domain